MKRFVGPSFSISVNDLYFKLKNLAMDPTLRLAPSSYTILGTDENKKFFIAIKNVYKLYFVVVRSKK